MEINKSGTVITKKLDDSGNIVETSETIASFNQNSVDISLNSKGKVQFEVKCYASTLVEAEQSAILIFNGLREKYKNELPS